MQMVQRRLLWGLGFWQCPSIHWQWVGDAVAVVVTCLDVGTRIRDGNTPTLVSNTHTRAVPAARRGLPDCDTTSNGAKDPTGSSRSGTTADLNPTDNR
jgi:hypothetical protein